jgi:hypothetical protein
MKSVAKTLERRQIMENYDVKNVAGNSGGGIEHLTYPIPQNVCHLPFCLPHPTGSCNSRVTLVYQ